MYWQAVIADALNLHELVGRIYVHAAEIRWYKQRALFVVQVTDSPLFIHIHIHGDVDPENRLLILTSLLLVSFCTPPALCSLAATNRATHYHLS